MNSCLTRRERLVSLRLHVKITSLSLFFAGVAAFATACATSTSSTEKRAASASISYDIGLEALARGDSRGALRELLRTVATDDEFAPAHHALGLVYHNLGRLDDALKHYNRAIELRPKFSEAYNNRGVLLIDMGRYDDAIASFKVSLSDILYETPSLAEGNMGWAYYKKGDVDNAVKHLGNAIAVNPAFCRGYEWLMRIGLDSHNAPQVVANGKRFKKYCMDNPTIGKSLDRAYLREMQYYVGVGYLQQGDAQNARQWFSQCADVDAEDGFGAKCTISLQTMK